MSAADTQYMVYLLSISQQMPIYFSYFMPWIGLACSIIALIVLFFFKPTEDTIIIFIFKWQYSIVVLYSLNMIFLDPIFSVPLFGYNPGMNVSDALCAIQYVLMRFIYCLSPWMQAVTYYILANWVSGTKLFYFFIFKVITFDRLWSVFLRQRINIKRNKLNLSLLILLVFGLVLIANSINGWYYSETISVSTNVFNATLNRTVRIKVTYSKCTQGDKTLVVVQDLIFIIVRVGIPVIIMFVCNFILIKHVRTIRSNVARTNTNHNQRHENKFTMAVWFINTAFFLLNLPYFVFIIFSNSLQFTGYFNTLSMLSQMQIVLFQQIAVLLSYMFTLSEFWIDLVLNRLFRAEIRRALFTLLKRPSQIIDSTIAAYRSSN